MNNEFPIVKMVISIVIVVLFTLRGIFADESLAISSLKKQGYSDIHVTDKSFLFIGFRGCDGYDAAKFTAKVTNPVGNDTEVFVCVGWPFKGATIRTD